jgi:hypothetical protein
LSQIFQEKDPQTEPVDCLVHPLDYLGAENENDMMIFGWVGLGDHDM